MTTPNHSPACRAVAIAKADPSSRSFGAKAEANAVRPPSSRLSLRVHPATVPAFPAVAGLIRWAASGSRHATP